MDRRFRKRLGLVGLVLLVLAGGMLLLLLVKAPRPEKISLETEGQLGQETLAEDVLIPEEKEETVASGELEEGDTAGKSGLLAEEESRLAAEASKAAEESSRAAEESSRAAEESSRAAEESSRAAEESSRAAEESSRAAEESSKAAEESSLAAAESSRAAEESRIAAESSKAAEEASKAAAGPSPDSARAGTALASSDVEAYGEDAWFYSSGISDSVYSRMKGKSFGANCTTAKSDLRYLKVLHYTRGGEIRVGELVCHKDIASSLLAVFQELYQIQYPIQSMRLVDDYGGDDIASAAANNTSCFNFRVTAGPETGLSRHAYGKAIDVNPLYNPYVWYDAEGNQHCDPSNGADYIDRSGDYPYKMTADDPCVKIFKKYGFQWGGDWTNEKDYMHFSVK